MFVGNATHESEIKKDNVWVWDTLWKPKSKAKLKIDIAETVRLDERGHIKMWLFTSKIGTILKRTSKKSTYELLLQRFQSLHGKQQMAMARTTDLSSTVATLYGKGSQDDNSSKGNKNNNKSEETEIDLQLLNKICSSHTASQRYSTSLIQFKTISRTGDELLYHNTYQAPNPSNVRGVVSTSTYRIRRIMENVMEPVNTKTNSNIILSNVQQSLKRVLNMNRTFNNSLDEMTHRIIQAIQHRRKVVVTKFTGEYSINTDGKPVFIKALEVNIYNDPDKQVYSNGKRHANSPPTLPRRIRVNYENKPDNILGHKANAEAGRRLATTNNRALQFHTRDHELHTDDQQNIFESKRRKRRKKKNVFNRNDNIVKVHRKQCHGDFCGYRDKNVKSDDEDEEEMMPRPRSSSPQKKQKYVRWTRESAMKKEFNKTNKQVQELREKHKIALVAEVQENLETSQMKRNLRQASPQTQRPSSTGSTASSTASTRRREKKSNTKSRFKSLSKNDKQSTYPLAFRLIANARVDMQYMSDNLAKWYLTDRSQKRRGDGPWLYVTAPSRTSKYTVGRTVRCLWEWAGVVPCTKIQLFAGFDKVFDVVMSTKNDGTYTFDIPKNIYNGLKAHVRGNMWRLKISDTNNPNTYSYSQRFVIQRYENEVDERRKLRKEMETEEFNKYNDIMRDLDREEMDQSREFNNLPGMPYFINSLRQNTNVPASLKYSQITVCRECYLVYNRLQLRKRDIGRLKDAGCVVDDRGKVVKGQAPVNAVVIRPLDESRLEQQMKAIVDGVKLDKRLPQPISAVERHRQMVRKREKREEHQNILNKVCMDIETNVARGLGVSKEKVEELNKAYTKARSVGVPTDAPSMRNADFVKQKAKKLNRKQHVRGQLPPNGMFNQYVSGPSTAWEASDLPPRNMFGGDISSSDDDDEPLIANPRSFDSFMRKAPTIPPPVTVGTRRKGWTLVEGLAPPTLPRNVDKDDDDEEEPLISGGYNDADDDEDQPYLGNLTSQGKISTTFQSSQSVPLIPVTNSGKLAEDYLSPTRASLLRQREKSYPILNTKTKDGTNIDGNKKKKKKIRKRIVKEKEPSTFGSQVTTTIESRYDKIIPLLEARGAGAREFRLENAKNIKRSPKKVPWNSASGEFDASSPAQDRNLPFGEPAYNKKRRKKKNRRMRKSKNPFSDKFKKKKRRYPPKPATKFVPFKKTKANGGKTKRKILKPSSFLTSILPDELRHDASLRKVVCVLVLGQLADIRGLLRVYSADGANGLAKNFTSSGIDDILNENNGSNNKVTILLENFVCCANVFASLFGPFSMRSKKGEKNTLGFCKGADVDPGIPWSSETVTADVTRLVKEFLQWFGVGISRYLIFEGVSHWVAGSVVLAHRKWKQAAVEADRAVGKDSYDGAVANFLIGRHMDVRTQSLERKRHLRKSLTAFINIGSEAAEESSVLRHELKLKKDKRRKRIANNKDSTTNINLLSIDNTGVRHNIGGGRGNDDDNNNNMHDVDIDRQAHEHKMNNNNSNNNYQNENEDQDIGKSLMYIPDDQYPIAMNSPEKDDGNNMNDEYIGHIENDGQYDNEEDQMNHHHHHHHQQQHEDGNNEIIMDDEERYKEIGTPLQELWEQRGESVPETPQEEEPGLQSSLVKTMYGPTTPGYMGPITPNYGPGSHIYQSPLTPGYDNPPNLTYNDDISTGPTTPLYGPVYTPQDGSMISTADGNNNPMPLTPGITGSITDGGQIPKTEIEITPLYDDEDSKDTMHDEEGEMVIDPLYMKQRRVAELPPLHKKDAEMRIRTIKAKALDEMREKFSKTPLHGSDSEDSTASTIRDLRESHEGDVEVLKVKLQAERRRQREILKRKLEEDDNKKGTLNTNDNEISQQNQLSMINTHVTSEVATLKDRLIREKDRQRENLKRRLADRKRSSSGHKDQVNKAAEAAYTFYATGEDEEKNSNNNNNGSYNNDDNKNMDKMSTNDDISTAPSSVNMNVNDNGSSSSMDAITTGMHKANLNGTEAVNHTLSKKKDKTTKALLSARLGNMSDILFKMIRTKKLGALKAMLDAGSDILTRNEAGDTLLIEAAKIDDIDLLHMLIARGGKQLLDAQNYEGNTALHYIFARNDPVSASFLIANGADEFIKNMYGLGTRDGIRMSDYDNLQF